MMLSWLSVFIGLALPVLVAVLWLLLLVPQPIAGRWPLLLAYGYLLGMIMLSLLLQMQAWLGWGLNYWPTMSALAVLGLVALYLHRAGWIADHAGQRPEATSETMSVWHCVLGICLLVLLGLRLIGLALEVWWLPLLPWDAWTTWTVRAKIWSHYQDIVPFVSPDLWLADPQGTAYTISAWNYPVTVSLLATWPALAFGTWNDTVSNLPWVGAGLALLMAFYGQVRVWGATPLTALVFCWLLLSLPMLDTHIALAGYADLWLATALGLAFFAMMQWANNADWRQAVLAVLAALACVLLKREGSVWILLFLPAMFAAKLRSGWLLSIGGIAGILVAAIWRNGGIRLEVPMLGELILSPELLQLPLVGKFPLQLSGSWEPVFYHLFIRNNWHLLPYLAIITFIASLIVVARAVGGPAQRVGLVWSLSALLAVYLLFFWTSASEWADKGTSINRILLQFAPSLLFWIFTVWHAVVARSNPQATGRSHTADPLAEHHSRRRM